VVAGLSSMDARTLAEAIRAAHRAVEWNKAQMNALNVFPVPDGDTGTNMALTLESVVGGSSRHDTGSLPEATSSMAHSALMGARGNSGLILSQLFAGIAEATSGSTEFGPDELFRSLSLATDSAYSAVQNPTEGTMLTVLRLCRDAAEQSVNSNLSLLEAFSEVCRAANDAVEDSPNLLDVLAAAGVVDSGGYGLLVMFAGALSYLSGESNGAIDVRAPGVTSTQALSDFLTDAEEESWGYCTVFLITGDALDPGEIRTSMSELGRSAVVAGSGSNVKVHVHVDNPGPAVEFAAKLGTLSDITILNMDEQTADRATDQRGNQARGAPAVTLESKCGIVSIVVGSGMRRLFIDGGLGAVEVVTGGDSMNPSVGEIVAAIERCPQDEIVILPNNSNVIGTANQAANESSKQVSVVPTRSMQAGVSALLAYSPQLGASDNRTAMDAAASDVVVGSVTIATRDFDLNGENVASGSVIGILGEEIVAAGSDLHTVAMTLLTNMSQRGELLTIYRGDGVDQRAAGALAAAVTRQFGTIEVEIFDGGQPHYQLLVAVE